MCLLTVGRNAWNRPSPLAIASSIACRASPASSSQVVVQESPTRPFSVVNFEERQSWTIHQDDAAVGFEHLDAVARVIEDVLIEGFDLLEGQRGRECLTLGGGAGLRLLRQNEMAALEVPVDRHRDNSERQRDQQAREPEGKRAAARQTCLGGSLREQRVFGGAHLCRHRPHVVHDALAEARREACRCARGIAALAQLEHASHLLDPIVDKRRESPSPLQLSGAIGYEVGQAADQRMRFGGSALVGLKKVAVLREQVSAVPGFCVDESRQRHIN